MVEFGVNILETGYWTPKNHLHVDRGRMIRPDELSTLPAGTTQGYVKVDPVVANWTHAFAGVAAGNINGSASPFNPSADYQLVNFQPAAPTLQSAASCVIKPPGAPVQTWRQEFIDRLPTFRGGVRVMDLCATQSDYQTARDPASAGSWSGLRRRCPATYEVESADGVPLLPSWQSGSAWSVDELAALAGVVSEIHVCVPPLLMLPGNEAELTAWLSAFSAQSFTRIWVELSNEAWNLALGAAPYARMLQHLAVQQELAAGEHWLVGMAELYCTEVLRLRTVCQSISAKLVPIIAWQSTHIWAFCIDPWRGRPVNQTCYDALNTVGHLFIAPYFTEPTSASVQAQLDLITNWREPAGQNQIRGNLDARGVTLHAYEAGQHFDASQPVSVQTSAATLALWDTYLRGLHDRMDPAARVYLYGLAHAGTWSPGNCWGILEDIAVDNAKWTAIKATIDAIRLIAPVLP